MPRTKGPYLTTETLEEQRRAFLAENERSLRAAGEITHDDFLVRLSSEKRLPALLRWAFVTREVSGAELHALLRDWWSGTDGIYPNHRAACQLFELAALSGRGAVISRTNDDGERQVPARGEFTVYRGVDYAEAFDSLGRRKSSRTFGISWTIDRDKAVWFTHARYTCAKRPHLITATARAGRVLGYFDDRGETEVVLDPSHLAAIRIEPVKHAQDG